MRPVIRYELQVYVQTNYEFNSERKHFTQIETKSKRSSIITSYRIDFFNVIYYPILFKEVIK